MATPTRLFAEQETELIKPIAEDTYPLKNKDEGLSELRLSTLQAGSRLRFQ
jgi:hypothetical protein